MWCNDVRQHLENTIIPFWSNLRDDENGGFYGLMDYDQNIYKDFEKGVILHSRILWFFSNCYMVLGDTKCLQNATHAYDFIKRYCIDYTYGGVYLSVQYNGQMCDSRKYTYIIAFAIYALSSYYDASKNEEALKLAEDLYEVIETKCKDEKGYLEAFTREFTEDKNDLLSENGVVASRTMNTLLHVFEGYTEFYRVTKKESVRKNLEWILDEFADKVYNPEKKRLEVFFDDDMHSIIDLHSFGHDIESAWLIDRGCEVLGEEAYIEKLSVISRSLAKTIYETAYHDHSLWNECVNQELNKMRIWWVQAEAVVGFLNEFQHVKDKKYLDAAMDIWNYIGEYIVDKRPNSEWLWGVNDQGKVEKEYINKKDNYRNVISEDGDAPMYKPLVEPWKCPYHNGRMCLEIIRRSKDVE